MGTTNNLFKILLKDEARSKETYYDEYDQT